MRRIRAFAAFLALGGLAAVAACTSADGSGPSSPPPLTTPSTSVSIASPSSSPPPSSGSPTVPPDVPRTGPNTKPGETPPVMPVVATQHTGDGAKAFAEFFVKTIDWGYATTSSAYMRHYFDTACEGCKIFADAMDAAQKSRHRYIGGRFAVHESQRSTQPPLAVVVHASSSSFEEVDAQGHAVRADVAHPAERFYVSLAWTNQSWIVTKIEIDT